MGGATGWPPILSHRTAALDWLSGTAAAAVLERESIHRSGRVDASIGIAVRCSVIADADGAQRRAGGRPDEAVDGEHLGITLCCAVERCGEGARNRRRARRSSRGGASSATRPRSQDARSLRARSATSTIRRSARVSPALLRRRTTPTTHQPTTTPARWRRRVRPPGGPPADR